MGAVKVGYIVAVIETQKGGGGGGGGGGCCGNRYFGGDCITCGKVQGLDHRLDTA